MKHYVYLAGPMTGLTYDEAQDWRKEAARLLNSNEIQTLNPLRGKNFLANEQGVLTASEITTSPLTTYKGITRRDMDDTLRSSCLLVNLLGAKEKSIGTVMEIAWAYQARIPIVVVMEQGNIHEHAMIEEAVTYKLPSLSLAADAIRVLLTGKEEYGSH